MRRFVVEAAAGAVLLLALAVAAPASAETFVVNRFDDADGPCTLDDCALREAILAANALPGLDVVEVPGGTYQLSLLGPVPENSGLTGDLDILDDLELFGDPASPPVIVGDGTDRVIHTQLEANHVVISDVVITGGISMSVGGGLRAGADYFELRRSTIRGNMAFDGGGLYTNSDELLIEDCTFRGNSAFIRGGAVFMQSASLFDQMNLVNVTISENSARFAGGVYAFGNGNMRLIHATIADNTATDGSTGLIGDSISRLSFTNSLIVNNTCGYLFVGVLPTSNGGNVEGPSMTCLDPNGPDLLGVPDLVLEPLADNGGVTQTRALPLGSPAIDVAIDADCPATDQRGLGRPQDGDGVNGPRCDAGAYEAAAVAVVDVPGLGVAGRMALFGLLLFAGVATLRD